MYELEIPVRHTKCLYVRIVLLLGEKIYNLNNGVGGLCYSDGILCDFALCVILSLNLGFLYLFVILTRFFNTERTGEQEIRTSE